MLVGYQHRDRNLTIVLLAELPAILPDDANGMNALLGESCVVDDPDFYSAALLDAGRTNVRTCRSRASCDQSALATKWCSDWCAP